VAGGVIVVTAENVRADGVNGLPADFVRLSVRDTGTGMSADVQARAFEPFFTTKDVSKGSGLGLPQVYGFAHQSGGRVAIESAVGSGTAVHILLPRADRPPVEAAVSEARGRTASRSSGARRGHLLLVEDDKEVAAVTVEMLGSLGFVVSHVTSADAALAALAQDGHGAIDVVLTDIMMPGGVSGLMMAREIRRRHPTLPVTLTTGYVEAASNMKDGEFNLLLKPYTLEALAEAFGVDVD
jgi:CheY-like chemotaxis protein